MFSTDENEKEFDMNVIRKAFQQVIDSYVEFLRNISRVIVEKCTDYVEREKRKFNAVRKELLDFLFKHRKFFTLTAIKLLSDDLSILHNLSLDSSDNFEHSLNLDDVSELELKINNLEEVFTMSYVFDEVEEEIIRKIKTSLKRSVILDEDIHLFLENNYLVDKNDLKSNCTNYIELQTYIDSRCESYRYEKVSTGHIYKMVFKFQGSIKNFEDEKSCCVCLEDYKKDQEVCRLPCNHFCCRNCTEKMFAIPEDGSTAYFQCPICRDDCT